MDQQDAFDRLGVHLGRRRHLPSMQRSQPGRVDLLVVQLGALRLPLPQSTQQLGQAVIRAGRSIGWKSRSAIVPPTAMLRTIP